MDDEIRVTEDDLIEAGLSAETIVVQPEDLPPAPATLSVEIQDVICTFCHDAIAPDESAVACRECQAPYHKACWDASGGCGVLRCNSRQCIPYV